MTVNSIDERSDRRRVPLLRLAAVAGLMACASAGATDGYVAHGYGMKSSGMGGASVARTDDAFGGANNPAQMAFVGDRLDFGMSMFSPSRGAQRTGASIPTLNGNVDSDMKQFWIPEFGYNAMLRRDLSLGVSVYGNGGMNTDYAAAEHAFGCPNPRTGAMFAGNMLCGQGRLGVDLLQMVIAPTTAWQVVPGHAIGVAPLITIQKFRAEGLQYFAPFSTDPNSLTDNGYDYSRGIGVRIGYLGRINDFLSVGAEYATKTSMSDFTKYKGLFARGGSFDLPSSYAAGVQLRPAAHWTVALDFERILYKDVASVGNPGSLVLQCAGGNLADCLGGSNGAGFGWRDTNVLKLGVEYTVGPALIVRAGYNHSSAPIEPADVTFNILAPGVVQNHYTVGLTHPFAKRTEVTAAFMYAPSRSVAGSSLFNPIFQGMAGIPNAGGTETIHLSEIQAGLALGLRF